MSQRGCMACGVDAKDMAPSWCVLSVLLAISRENPKRLRPQDVADCLCARHQGRLNTMIADMRAEIGSTNAGEIHTLTKGFAGTVPK